MHGSPNGSPQTRWVAIYARTSTEDQAERQTEQGQLEFLRRFCSLYSHVQRYEIAAEYVDDGWSGTVPLGERPDGHRLLEDARAGRFQEVLAYRLDRLGRSLQALLDANAALEAAGVTIHSATEPFDTATPIGRFVFQLLDSLAELERSTITERMTLGEGPGGADREVDNRPDPHRVRPRPGRLPSAERPQGERLRDGRGRADR